MQRRLSTPGFCHARRCATTGAGPCFMAKSGYIIKRQSTEAFGRISYPGFARAVGTWKHGSLFLDVWVLHVEYRKLHSSGDLCSGGNVGSTVDTCSPSVRDALWTIFTYFPRCRGLESCCVYLRSHAEWRSVLSRCSSLLSRSRCAHLEIWTLFLISRGWQQG